MSSYAPKKPLPKRQPRHKPLNPDWLERQAKAAKTVTALVALQQDELLRSYLIAAQQEINYMAKATLNKDYQLGFAKVQRLVLLGLGLTRER